MKDRAALSGYDIDTVVMGRPVHFVDYNPSADDKAQNELRAIANQIGFKNVEFQYEPIAAAFAHEQNIRKEQLALVVDIGGGTSDFTIIRLSNERKRLHDRSEDILANTGIRIGGNDFDKSLSIKSIMPYFGYASTFGSKKLSLPNVAFHDISEWSKINFTYTRKMLQDFQKMLRQSHSPEKLARFVKVLEHRLGHHLLQSTEMAKIALTQERYHEVDLNYIEDNFLVGISQQELNNTINGGVQKIITNIDYCLKNAQVKSTQIDLVILTGGSTEIPYIQETLFNTFPKANISQENKFSSVALGLGYDAQRKFK